MKKELVIQAKFSTEEFDRSIEKMQAQLKSLQAPVDFLKTQQKTAQQMQAAGMGGSSTNPTQQQFARATQEQRRNLEQSLTKENAAQEKLGKFISKRLESIKELENKQKSLIKGSQEEVALAEKLARVRENSARQQETFQQRAQVIGQMAEAKQQTDRDLNKDPVDVEARLGRGNKKGGGSPTPGIMSIIKGVFGQMTMAVAGLAAGAAVVDQYTSIPLQRSQALGSASQNLFGGHLQNFASGNVINETAYQKERQVAYAMALQKQKDSENTTDWILRPRKWVGEALQQNIITGNAFYGLGKKVTSSYEAQKAQELGQNYAQEAQAQIENNQNKKIAADWYSARASSDLAAQRSMGLRDNGFYGTGAGFNAQATNAGFTGDLRMDMANQIQAAGGSTRGMKGYSSIMALQAQRGFDMTNAGSVMGRISGAAGSQVASDAIFKRLLEEAITKGLDKSDFRQEQNKFADITSQILAQTGVKTSADAAMVLSGFSKYVGQNTTMQGLAGAQSAYQQQQGFSAETSGRGGVLNFASMLNSPMLSKMNPIAMGGAGELPDKDLIPSNPDIISWADQLNTTPEKLVAELKKSKRNSMLNAVQLDPKEMDALANYMTAHGEDFGAVTSDQLKTMDPKMKKIYNKVRNRAHMRGSYGGIEQENAMVRGYISNDQNMSQDEQDMLAAAGRQADYQLENKETGRVGDTNIQAQGVAFQAMLENFGKFKDVLTPTAEELGKLTKQVLLLSAAAAASTDPVRAAELRKAANALSQPTAGKPGP